MYSGGRDKKIYMTDLRNPDNRVLICEETAAILKVIISLLPQIVINLIRAIEILFFVF